MVLLMISTIEDDDDRAFMLNLYNNYYGLVRKTVYSITHDNKDIEDLINDVFVKLIGKISVLRNINCCKTAAYVVYTTRSVTINYLKHLSVIKKHTFYGEDADIADSLINSTNSIAVDTENASSIEKVNINGQDGTLSIKNAIISVAWSIDNHLFTVQGNISKDEVIKIANNVKFIK